MLNTVALVGRLVDIPEMKTTIGGVKVANATIQIEQGIAEMIIDCARPGCMIAVKGRLHSRTLECAESKQITSIEVIAERVSLLDKYFKNYD